MSEFKFPRGCYGFFCPLNQIDGAYAFCNGTSHFVYVLYSKRRMRKILEKTKKFLQPGQYNSILPRIEKAKWLPSDKKDIRVAGNAATTISFAMNLFGELGSKALLALPKKIDYVWAFYTPNDDQDDRGYGYDALFALRQNNQSYVYIFYSKEQASSALNQHALLWQDQDPLKFQSQLELIAESQLPDTSDKEAIVITGSIASSIGEALALFRRYMNNTLFVVSEVVDPTNN